LGGWATYRVAFDGKWQGKFEDQNEALEWASEVGETGRIAHVAASRWSPMRLLGGRRLVAVFPEDRAEEGKHLWKVRRISIPTG
jgi:hypothetical protein